VLGIARLAGPSIDYYVEPEVAGRRDPTWPEAGGQWCGRGAEGLRRRGAVHPAELGAVLAGCRPDGRPLASRRPTAAAGYDLTFSAPKSLSVL
jgi:conjugative relaxase-like TrwC/TraI family protein